MSLFGCGVVVRDGSRLESWRYGELGARAAEMLMRKGGEATQRLQRGVRGGRVRRPKICGLGRNLRGCLGLGGGCLNGKRRMERGGEVVREGEVVENGKVDVSSDGDLNIGQAVP